MIERYDLDTIDGRLAPHLVITSDQTISETHQGTVSLEQRATSIVHGAIQGSVTVAQGATLVIEATGRLAGTLVNNGTLVLRGVFGGAQSGRGDMRIEGSGYIKQPIIRDGMSFY